MKDWQKFVVNGVGIICALIGLTEIIRLVITYAQEYGMIEPFWLEVLIYIIGIGWALLAFIDLITPGWWLIDVIKRD